MTSLSRRGSVNPSTPTFGKISLTKTMIQLTVPWKCSQKQIQESLFAPQTLSHYLQVTFISDVTFPSWPSKSVNPQFSQYQSYKNNYKFTCCFKCHQNMAVKTSITTHSTFLRDRNCFLIRRHFPRRGLVNMSTLILPISILQKQLQIHLLFQMSPKYGCNNLYYHPLTLSKRQKLFSYLTSFSRSGLVNMSTLKFTNINLTKTITDLSVVSNVTKIWL